MEKKLESCIDGKVHNFEQKKLCVFYDRTTYDDVIFCTKCGRAASLMGMGDKNKDSETAEKCYHPFRHIVGDTRIGSYYSRTEVCKDCGAVIHGPLR